MTTKMTSRRRWLWVAAGALVLVIIAVGAVWLTGREQAAHDEAAHRMVEQVAAAPDGTTVDLSEVFAVPWDRAVLMDPYSDGKAMNARLGFDAYPGWAMGPQDESNQLVVFVRSNSVVAEADLFPGPGYFRFDPNITEFPRDAAVFVVKRDDDNVRLLRP